MEYLDEIYSIFEKDPLIDELGIILTNDPPYVLHIEHKIGISMSILKPLFHFASKHLQPPFLFSIDDNKFLEKLSLCALLVKGDFPPALNIRKKLIQQNLLQPQRELQLIQVILSKHSKSPSCWHHRRWCIEFLNPQMDSHSFSYEEFWSKELQLCDRMCDIYPRNYYSWNHRLWICNYLGRDQVIPLYPLVLH
jgi:protein prenyltransferase alpha subunit repeat containing protein 1